MDGNKAFGDAIGNADLFDASTDVLVKKMPGGLITSEVLEHLTPSMGDITIAGGVQVGGKSRDMSDVAVDFSFSVLTDKIKGVKVPKMKFSGNFFVKSIKNSLIDFASSQGSDAAKNISLPSRTLPSQRTYQYPWAAIQEVRDNTRVRQTFIKAHGN